VCKEFFKAVTTVFVYELIRQDGPAREAFEGWFKQTYPGEDFLPSIEDVTTGEPDMCLLPALNKYVEEEIWPAVIDYLDDTSLVHGQVFLKLTADLIFEIQPKDWQITGDQLFPPPSALREKLNQGATAQLIKEFQERTGKSRNCQYLGQSDYSS